MTQQNLAEIQKNVNNPTHYTSGKHEVIETSRGFNFDLGNAWKYLCRWRLKGAPTQDLLKACWYINDLLEHKNPVVSVEIMNDTIQAEKNPHVKKVLSSIRDYVTSNCVDNSQDAELRTAMMELREYASNGVTEND